MDVSFDINPVWISLGPIIAINAVLLVSYLYYQLWARKRMSHDFAGAKDHSSRMLSGATRDWWMWTTDPIVRTFVRLRMGPNMLTVIGFLFTLVAAYFFGCGRFGYAGWFMIFGATFDIFDGRVARITGKTSRSGAFFDAVMDRFSEGACMLGLAYFFRDSWMLPVVVAALVGSLLVSYTKARAESVGVACNVGTMQRPERIVYLGVASIFSPIMSIALMRWWEVPPPILVMVAMCAIAVLTNGTAVYRMIHTMNALDTEDKKGEESIPQIIHRLATHEGREAFWDRARYGYDRSRATHSHVVLFLVGGAGFSSFERMMAVGELPNISKHIVERGGLAEAVGTFPSTVGIAGAPFVTGCFPGTCNLPGVRWFDRTVPESRVLTMNRFRDYLGWGAYAMDHDLSKSVRTLFEYSRQAVNIFGMLNRGCGLVRDPAFFSLHNRFYRAKRPADVDVADEAAIHWFSSALKRETDFVLYSFPTVEFSGPNGIDDDSVREAWRKLDGYIGRAVELLKERGMYDDTAILMAGDHGQGELRSSFDLHDFLGKRYSIAPMGRRMRDWHDADMIALPSGTSMFHVYVRKGDNWADRMFFEEVERRGLVGSLLEQDGVDVIAGRSMEGGIVIQSRRGRAHVLEDADGRITYFTKGGDPFGYGAVEQVIDSRTAFATTAESAYPDGMLQVLQLFRSPRTGDLVIGASEGCSMVARGSSDSFSSTHGSLCRSHMLVPFASSEPIGAARLRTVDVFSIIMNMLGIEGTHDVDGILPSGISAIAGEAVQKI